MPTNQRDRLAALSPEEALSRADSAAQDLADVSAQIKNVIIGQDQVIDQSLITLLAGGHGLLVGLPGLAKTLLVRTLGTVLGLDENRVQFTPDLLPADILGSEVLEEDADGKRAFRFVHGPIFTQLLMADEINRASPRTQSALLQAMQEGFVTVAGKIHSLPQPFHVLATQNPIEQEGTYPLPEAQLDRFLLQIDVDYPERDAEKDMLIATTQLKETAAKAVLTPEKLIEMQGLVRLLPIGDEVVEAILDVVRAARPGPEQPDLMWGPGPRAGQALMLTTRARALLQGRLAPGLEDVAALAPSVLRHRMALNYMARADGKTVDTVIDTLIDAHIRL
ncbi:MAG: MoxR family ATPase [Pseudomonadota bacterium]